MILVTYYLELCLVQQVLLFRPKPSNLLSTPTVLLKPLGFVPLLHSNEIKDYSRVVLYPIEFSKFRYQCCVRLATYPLTRYMICMKNHISRSVGGRMGADFCPIYFNTPFRSLFTKNYNPLVSKIGYSVWTKLIRNNTAVQYLFNADAFNFNYQFANRLPKPIKIYPVRNKTANIHQILSIFRETHLLLAVYTIHETRMRSHW
jgi:hypothetical protein